VDSPGEVRRRIRAGELTGNTSGVCLGYVQANLVALPAEMAEEFTAFCRANPAPLPLLDVTAPGDPEPRRAAPGADLRTDLPRYRIWRSGRVEAEVTDATPFWSEDLVGFLLGCSFTAEARLLEAGVPIRHLALGRNVTMFRTSTECRPVGRFHGPVVVSMRPLKPADAIRAIQITTRFPAVHGAPVHIGKPELIGIKDIMKPDYGDPAPMSDDEIPVFWACGVTPQSVVATVKPEFCITHYPGCMLVTDRKNSEFAIM